MLTVEATLGSVGLVDVEDLEMVSKEESTDARGRSWRRVFQILPGTIAESNNSAFPCCLGLAFHSTLESGYEL